MSNTNEIKEVAQELIGWENNRIWLTIRDLTLRPGHAIRAYCEGNAKRYLSPVTYFFAASAIVLYLTSLNSNRNDVETKSKKERVYREDRIISGKEFIEGELGNKIMQVVFIPITLLFRWLLFRKYNNSFKENAWYSLFTQGHKYFVLGSLHSLSWYVTSNLGLTSIVILVTGLSYDTWSSCQFYKINLKTSIIWNVLFNILYFVCIGIVFVGIVKFFIV